MWALIVHMPSIPSNELGKRARVDLYSSNWRAQCRENHPSVNLFQASSAFPWTLLSRSSSISRLILKHSIGSYTIFQHGICTMKWEAFKHQFYWNSNRRKSTIATLWRERKKEVWKKCIIKLLTLGWIRILTGFDMVNGTRHRNRKKASLLACSLAQFLGFVFYMCRLCPIFWPVCVAPLLEPACNPISASRNLRTSSSVKFRLFSADILGPNWGPVYSGWSWV